MTTPTSGQLKETAESIARRRNLYEEAVLLRDERFQKRFAALDEETRRAFVDTRQAYLQLKEGDETSDPRLRKYYRKAAMIFHPNTAGSDEKVPFFRLAKKAYEDGDLMTLQTVVLQDMAANFDRLDDDNRGFLFQEYDQMETVNNNIWTEAAEIAVAAGQLELMSDQMFLCEITDAIKHMKDEITQKGISLEAQTPPLLEGR